jgi:hypothetical protein
MVEAPRSSFGIFGKAVQIAHGLSLPPNFTPAYCPYFLRVLKHSWSVSGLRTGSESGRQSLPIPRHTALCLFSVKIGKYYFDSPSGPTRKRWSAGFFKDSKDKSGKDNTVLIDSTVRRKAGTSRPWDDQGRCR